MSSRRRSEWERFRKRQVLNNQSVATLPAKQERASTVLPNRHHDKIQEEFKRKLSSIQNSSAPLSVPDRHYPKEFTIPKKEEREE